MYEKLIYLQRNNYVLDHLYLDFNSIFYETFGGDCSIKKGLHQHTSQMYSTYTHTVNCTPYSSHYPLHTTHDTWGPPSKRQMAALLCCPHMAVIRQNWLFSLASLVSL